MEKKKRCIMSYFFIVLVLLAVILIIAFLILNPPGLPRGTPQLETSNRTGQPVIVQPKDLTPIQAEELVSGFASWNDICVESVKPIAVGITKPFSPWSPDGEWIAYSNYYSGEDQEAMEFNVTEPVGVYVIRYNGSDKRLLALGGFRPSFGRYQWKIVYGMNGTSGKLGYKSTKEEDIWIVNFDGTENRPIAADEEDNRMKNYGGSSITYDGRHVIYNIMKDVGGGMGIVDIDGSNKRPLVIGSGIWGYSSDGKKAFVQSVDNIKKDYIAGAWMDIEKDVGINTESADAKRLDWITKIKYPEHQYGHPHVNFDGTAIVYDDPSSDYPLETREIWLGSLDGSNKHYQLTDYDGVPKFANHPRWSPGGKWVVYDEQEFVDIGVKDKVMIINVETQKKKMISGVITVNHCGWTEPGWSPDGKKIFFYAPDPNNDNKPSIWIAVLKECEE